jgi:hypothetical protein
MAVFDGGGSAGFSDVCIWTYDSLLGLWDFSLDV